MTREHVRNFSGTCPQGPLGAGLPLPPRAPRRGGRRVWAGAALVLLLAAPVLAQTNTPPVITSATTFTVNENTTPVATLTADDSDTAVTDLTWSKTGGADSGKFNLTSAGVLTFSTAPDYEAPADADTDHVYEVTVQVSDGTTPVPADLEVTVENVTELTTPITGPEEVDYAENDAGRVAAYAASSEADRAGIEWILAGADAEHFSIDTPAGVLRFDIDPVAPNLFPQLPDSEAPDDADADNAYEVSLLARVGSTTTASLSVTVTVTDVDEAGAISLSSTRPQKGSALTATLTDPDGVTAGTAVWQWERSTGRNAWAVIDGAAAANYTPVAADTNTFLRVTATYADEHGTGKTVSEVAPNVVTGPLLTGLTAESDDSQAAPARGLYPAFDPQTLHYGIGCTSTDTLVLTVSAAATARVAVAGVQAANAPVSVAVTANSDVAIRVTDASGAGTTYVVHCLPEVFFEIETHTFPNTDAFEDLILFNRAGYFTLMDRNGVPRLHLRFAGALPFAVRFHRVGADGAYRYGFRAESVGYIILDEDFEVLADDVRTVAPLTRINTHDFQILEDGNYLLMSYEPATRDFSDIDLPYLDGAAVSSVDVRDAAFQIVTPGGHAIFTWNSWGNMAIEDCVQHRFPVTLSTDPDMRSPEGGYAHINGMHVVDGVLVASMRGCSKVLGIDVTPGATRGDVLWRMGRTNLSDAAWAARDIGPRPLDFINDPEGEFCGQHTARFLPNGNVFLYDNGVVCVIDPWTFDELGREGSDFSRAVEYALDIENHEAVFVRDHSLRGERSHLGYATGNVDVLDNGDWLVSWGRVLTGADRFPDNEMATLVDPATGQEKLGIRFRELPASERDRRINPTVAPAEALAPQPVPLTAEFPASDHTSLFHTGSGDAPQVIVAFSRPVVDFDGTTPSLSVTGATVASVSAHVEAGAPANAYLVTLTPAGDGPITFGLVADEPCADGGVCTADGTLLSAVPTAAHTIPGPVTVSFRATSYEVSEGGTASVVVELDRAHDRPDPVEIPLVIQTGGTATEHTDYTTVPASVTFGPTETSKTVSVATVADDSIEGAETVAVAFGALPTGVNAGTPTTTTVTITDRTPAAQFTLTLNPPTVVEGSTAAVTVSITNRVTFATAQPLTLTFSGSATQGTDYTVTPTPLTLLAEQPSATTTLRVLDDSDTENAETIVVAVAHGGTQVATQTATIPASDQPATTPHISVYAERSPVGEAEGAAFTVSRTGETTANLTVAVRVTESGSLLAGSPPTTVIFAVGQENVRLPLPTVDEKLVEGVSATSVVTVAVQADTTNDPPLYLLGSPASAQVTVEDDDEAAFDVTVTPNPVTEGTPATVTIAITNGVTFPADQTLTLVFSGTATQGTDYTGGTTTLTLLAGGTSVPTVLTVLDDKAEEPAETLGITAEHAGQAVGQATLTIAASADTAPPTLEQAEVPRAGRSLRLTFSESLDEANAPPSAAFVVTVDDNGTVTSMAVTSVVVSAETVTLSLAAPVLPGQVVTVDYTVPSSAWPALQDPAGNEVVSLVDEAVDNQAGRRRPPPPPVTGGGGGGGGGGGPACTEDLHSNSAAQATVLTLDTATPGAICPAADVDYFTVTAPGRGLLFVDTTGGGQLRGTLWQDGTVLASGATDGSGQAARLGARVQTGPVVVAIQGQGGATGAYEVIVTFTPGYLENPGPDSFQSGIGVLSGWVCDAAVVEIELNGVPQEAAYGTERLDTAGVCGDTDNGFGLLFNWNLLGDGAHEVVAYVDDVELGRATVTVTTLGEEFVRGVTGACTVPDFPSPGERVSLVWQQSQQNFVLADGMAPSGANRSGTPGVGYLENPGPDSFQSGVGVLSGWVCAAETVTLAIGEVPPQVAAYGTERLDTQAACGDTDNGFGLLFNWNLLGDGEHAVVAYVDEEELGRATVRVTTLGAEFLRGVEGECAVEDFPLPGETVTLAWQQNQQNFVMTQVE